MEDRVKQIAAKIESYLTSVADQAYRTADGSFFVESTIDLEELVRVMLKELEPTGVR